MAEVHRERHHGGTSTLALRVANKGSGAKCHVEIDGTNRTGPLGLPDTGGWQAWQTITKTGIALTAGSHVVRLTLDAGTSLNGGVGNYNSLTFTATASLAYGGTPVPLPGTVQMENFDEGGSGVSYYDTTAGNTGGAYRNTDVDLAATTDAGGDYYVGWTRPGEWLTVHRERHHGGHVHAGPARGKQGKWCETPR